METRGEPVDGLSNLPLWLRMYLRAYPWRRIDPVPLARRRKPLENSRVALVTTAGLVPPGATPFDESLKGGDFSYRLIPADADVGQLEEHHRSESFDHTGITRDRNLAFPLDRLRELAAGGEIGDVAPRHLSFMGSITAPGRLSSRTAPEAARLLAADGVDIALLLPV
jgi:D-proline reductase (dithiol) PrdB